MDKLSLVLPKVLNRRGLATQANAALVTFRAREWIKEQQSHLHSMVTVRMFKEGEIVIACAHSIAQQEIQASSDDLLQFLRQECPFVQISGLRIIRE